MHHFLSIMYMLVKYIIKIEYKKHKNNYFYVKYMFLIFCFSAMVLGFRGISFQTRQFHLLFAITNHFLPVNCSFNNFVTTFWGKKVKYFLLNFLVCLLSIG